jgi:hypothetical protein
MIYEVTGALAIVFVGLILYASIWLDVRHAYHRHRQYTAQLQRVQVVTA